MEPAFWDSSSLVPLCAKQQTTQLAESLAKVFSQTVWWGTPVEMRSAFARLTRIGHLTANGQVQALVALDRLRRVWDEVDPSEDVRERAGELVDRFGLKAGDAYQLAAAWVWCLGRPRNRPFISGDLQLLEAARQLGFNGIEA